MELNRPLYIRGCEGHGAEVMRTLVLNGANDGTVHDGEDSAALYYKKPNGDIGRCHEGGVIYDMLIAYGIELYRETEYRPTPFTQVLVRDSDFKPWTPDVFLMVRDEGMCAYMCATGIYRQCIPYQGNEHLVGKVGEPAVLGVKISKKPRYLPF